MMEEDRISQDHYGPNIKAPDNQGEVIGNQINNYYGKAFTDPTHIWKSDYKRGALSLKKERIKAFSEKLQTHRGILIYSEEEALLDDSIDEIIKELSGNPPKKMDRRLLFTYDNDNKDTDLKTKSLDIHHFSHDPFKRKHPTFIRVDITNHRFLDSMCQIGKSLVSSTIEGLRNNNIFLICRFSKEFFEPLQQSDLTLQKLQSDAIFPYCHVEFLNTYFEHHFTSNAVDLVTKILRQQAKGLWGPKKNQEELCAQIMDACKGEPEVVQEEISKRGKPNYKKTQQNFIQGLPFEQEPQKTILYTTAFFQNVSIWEYQHILECLFGDRSLKQEKNQKILDKDNTVQEILHIETVPLIDLWQEKREELIAQCKLQTRQTTNGSLTYDFTEPGIADGIRLHFQNKLPLYFIDQFEMLERNGLFFDTKYSEQTLGNMHTLVAMMSDYNPGNYTAKLLMGMYEKSIQKDDSEILTHFKFHRILGLVVALFKDDKYERSITMFLNYLLDCKYYFALLRVLAEFIVAREMDALFWAKKILDTNPDGKVYERVLDILVYDISHAGTKVYQKLKKINSWIGTEQEDKKILTAPHFAAFSFLFRISDLGTIKFAMADYGKWPSKHPLFQAMNKTDDPKAYINFLVRWLFNEHSYNLLIGSFENRKEKDETDIQVAVILFLTNVLEYWGLVIYGMKIPKKSARVLTINQALIIALSKVLPQNRLNDIRVCLNSLAKKYDRGARKAVNGQQKKRKKVARYLKAKKNVALQLRIIIETALNNKK